MKQRRMKTSLVIASLACSVMLHAVTPFLPDSTGLVVFEAENYHEQLPGKKIYGTTYEYLTLDVDSASNGQVVMPSPAASPHTSLSDIAEATDKSPVLVYKVRFAIAGIYWLWSRGRGNDQTNMNTGNHDSFHIGIDGVIQQTSLRMDYGAFARFYWTHWQIHGQNPEDVRYITVADTGIHDIQVYMRESGTIIDKIAMTPDSAWTPPDSFSIGPMQSPQQNVAVNPIVTNQPNRFTLAQNYPNPFNNSTVISYELQKTSNVKLKVFNTAGQNVITLNPGNQSRGRHQIRFDASGLPSGVYHYQVISGQHRSIGKMILLK